MKSRLSILQYLGSEGYEVVDRCKSPVGEVPDGSIVLTDYNNRRAVWFLGAVYQKPQEVMEGEDQGLDEEY